MRLGLAAVLLSSCGTGHQAGPAPSATRAAPQAAVEVVVSAYPLAVLVSYVGGKAVKVVDLAPSGVPPEDLALRPAEVDLVRSAPLVVDVGEGYQPQVEAVARTAHRHLSVLPALSSTARPYQFWLDPALMGKAAALVARDLSAIDAGAKTQFENGSLDFQSVVGSIESDLESTFSDCSRQVFVTSDDAFGRFAASYDLTDVAVSALGVDKTAALVTQDSLPDVFSEVGVPAGLVQKVAQAAGVGVKSLDPMELAPSTKGPAPLSYFAVMEQDLTALEVPLACDTTDDY
ncbi:MAG: metal ABC transporter substrate-binding protein [Acidimicrobiales bacterium]